MESRIDKLKEKYWMGETTLKEEKELKEYFERNPSLTKEGAYFSSLKNKKSRSSYRAFAHPGKKYRQTWLSAAAVIIVLLTVSIFFFQNDNSQDKYAVEDPTEAYEITKASLMMVSEGLNKGKNYSKELNKINEAKKIIKN
jgi:hypothetical protein